ncbi:helix-turn-helix transcriptional regulator [Citreimonas salinaria]|uniref:helix-turn-helix transcriptional regulator n=1 Tax=Citreimonas salinaria TaxID=321339 RepID=UPI003CCBD5FE
MARGPILAGGKLCSSARSFANQKASELNPEAILMRQRPQRTASIQDKERGAARALGEDLVRQREVLVRLPQIIGDGGILPVSRTTFYSLIAQGKLPEPIKLGPRISCWRLADIEKFIDEAEEV